MKLSCLRPVTRERLSSSWIGEHITRYAVCLEEQGYARASVYERVLWLLRFGEFAQARGAKSTEALPRLVAGFSRSARPGEPQARLARETHRMLAMALPAVAVRARSRDLPFLRAAPGFFDFLREERGLRPGSVTGYAYHLREFEDFLRRTGASRIRSLTPAIVQDFIAESSKRLGKGALVGRCGALRVFLRYLHRERRIARDIGDGIEGPRQYRLSDLPRAITWQEVRRVLAGIDRRSPLGRRDYAILLLLVTYGLRAREVAALKLEDIDWRRNRLRVPGRKADHSSVYPLSPAVGRALLAYLRRGRPSVTHRHVFLRALAPLSPMRHTAISLLAARRMQRAGISIPRAGSHTFRHTCVQRLVDADFSLKSIGDYVGHRTPQSTEIYSKVAIEPLRALAISSEQELL